MYPSLFTAVMGAAPEEERTHAVGTFSVFFDLSQGLGATLVGVVVSLTSGNERAGFAARALAFGGSWPRRCCGTASAGLRRAVPAGDPSRRRPADAASSDDAVFASWAPRRLRRRGTIEDDDDPASEPSP